MAFEVKVATRHTASVSFAIAPTLHGLAHISAKNGMDDAVQKVSDSFDTDAEVKQVDGIYMATFGHANSLEQVYAAASSLVSWMAKQDKYLPRPAH
jgi:predicted HAD superfamily hydrolase